MVKKRVYELAKEFGVDSKTVLERLKSMGEFVKSASSTVEAPVARRLKTEFASAGSSSGSSAAKNDAKPAANKNADNSSNKTNHSSNKSESLAQNNAEKRNLDKSSEKASEKQHSSQKPHDNHDNSDNKENHSSSTPNGVIPKPSAGHVKPHAIANADSKRGGDKRGENRNDARGDKRVENRSSKSDRSSQMSPRPRPHQGAGSGSAPRPGNNPFSRKQGMRAPTPGDIPRPHPMSRPGAAAENSRGAKPGQGGGNGNGGGRGRAGAAGAFGRQGGKSSKARKNRLAKRREYEELKAPVIGGVRIPSGNGATIRLRQGATLSDLAEKIDVNPAALVTVLFHLGEMATATQSLDETTFQILGEEIGWNINLVSAEEEDKELLQQFDIDLDEEELQEDDNLVTRPPVVTVMGHVDHGKTRLLDTIRKSNVVAREAGGITQRIGAYQVTVTLDGDKRKITFLDTPGHEAFTAMRARGAELTDVAILVVAADDGVMPQTVEAINHAQAAHVPIVVAVNKIDVAGANPDKVRGQLTEYGLVPEEYGGDTMFVDISAKQGTNVDKLLEAVLLTTDAELDPKANPNMDARGATVEARLDKGRGAVATVLVQQGTLKVGDSIVAGTSYGRVRAMLDENGNHLQEAGPSTPVQVLGLTSVPTAGDLFLVTSDDRSARQIAEKRQATERAAQLAKRRKVVSLESLKEQFAKSEVDMLNIVIKGDSSGSVEALEDSLMKIEVSDEVGIQVIHRGVGAITQNDVNLATVDKAVIIGFNVRPNRQVADLADREGVEVKYYSVIYKAIEDIEAALKGMLKPEFEEVVTSHSEIREIFRSSKFGNIAGVMVQDGEVKRGTKCRILRNGVATVNDLEISSLRRFKDDVQSVSEGYEAGINLGSFNDIELGDIIETFEMKQIERK